MISWCYLNSCGDWIENHSSVSGDKVWSKFLGNAPLRWRRYGSV